MKTCRLCKAKKPLADFCKKCDSADGLTTRCKACLAEARKADRAKRKDVLSARHKAWYEANKEAYNARRRANHDADKCKAACKKYYERNKDKIRAMNDEWAKQNPEKVRQAWKNYAKRNPDIKLAQAARRRASKRRAYAGWGRELTNFVVREASELCKMREGMFGYKWHVDHVVPLAGKKVSGLHVYSNLQVIPADSNWRKFNKFEASV